MTDLQHWVAQQLHCDTQAIVLQPASADASFRRYFRLHLKNESLIVMDASAETASCAPFIRIAKLLASGGVHVPHIIAAEPERGWMVLSDLGTQTYLDVLNDANADALFDAAVDALIAQQKIVCPSDFPQYDRALLQRELELFPDWYLQKHLRIEVDANLRAELDRIFNLLIDQILQQPKVFVHRDFMPRNLMISYPVFNRSQPGVLDFQDAVCGPIAYDPICLFKDAFISWPEARVEKWLRLYWQRARDAGLAVPTAFDDFYRDCDFIGTQRHLKVIGIFARICHRDGKPKYVGDVPRFFNYLRGACARRPEFAPLAVLLDQLKVDKLPTA
ncbi:MAG: phosphotransferase [Spongiibacteraceae bacterium]